MAIQSFTDKVARNFFLEGSVRKGVGWAGISTIVRRKLDMLHYASCLEDLKSPPSNRLEQLHGNLKGHYSIRVNDKWRIVFKWSQSGACDVRVVDYH